jgi:GNAT superfamily N-acetyltransferase
MGDPIEATRKASTIRKARPDEVDPLARTLARAFYDDPVAQWMLPGDGRRLSQLERAFEIGLNGVFMREGECWTTDGVVGGAIWQPPGRWRVPAGRQLRLLVPMALVYRGDLLRALGAFQALEREHPHERDHWYLPFIGVDPEWQGKGLGTALLRPILDRCDSAAGLSGGKHSPQPDLLRAQRLRGRRDPHPPQGSHHVEDVARARGVRPSATALSFGGWPDPASLPAPPAATRVASGTAAAPAAVTGTRSRRSRRHPPVGALPVPAGH